MPLKKQQCKYKVWEETWLLGLLAKIKSGRTERTEVVSSKWKSKETGLSPILKV